MDKEPFVTRWICKIDDDRYLMFDDEDDVEDWDEVLEIRIPATMAVNMDFTQHAYYTFQRYCSLQWEIVQRKLEGETDGGMDEGVSGDNSVFDQEFEAIIRHSRLDEIIKEENDKED